MGISHAQHMSLPYGHPVAFPATVGIAQPYGLPLPGLYAHAYATAGAFRTNALGMSFDWSPKHRALDAVSDGSATLDPNAYAQWVIAAQSWYFFSLLFISSLSLSSLLSHSWCNLAFEELTINTA
jgi:hypothetical protein